MGYELPDLRPEYLRPLPPHDAQEGARALIRQLRELADALERKLAEAGHGE